MTKRKVRLEHTCHVRQPTSKFVIVKRTRSTSEIVAWGDDDAGTFADCLTFNFLRTPIERSKHEFFLEKIKCADENQNAKNAAE